MAKSKGYNGNPNLSRAGEQFEWSPEQTLEMKKCMRDPVYFAEKYFKIVSVDHGVIPLKMYDFQKVAIRKYAQKKRKLAVCCSRQIGKTTFATAIILHYAMFNKHRDIALLANKGDTAREILSRVKLAFEHLPKWLQCGVVEWNKGSVEFENGSTIIAASSSSSSIRGTSKSMVYIDETAMIENWDDFSASVLPVLSSGKETILILTSTPNGLNHFYYYCMGAKAAGTDKWNGFEYIETKWFEVPGRDATWKAGVMADIGYDQNRFEREYECSFQGSTGCLISGNALRLMVGIDPIFKTEEGMKQYSRPEKDKKYILVADSSDGKGLDYSTFSIFDISKLPYEQVCTFRSNNTTPTDFALTINTVGKLYNNAFVVVENNNMGAQVASLLWEIHEYENLIRTENMGRGGKQITFSSDRRTEIGIKTTNPLKLLGCSLLKLLIEQNQMVIHDKNTIDELGAFIRKGASYEADQGKHDDMVTPLWLFAWMTQTKFWTNLIEQNVFDGMREVSGDVVDTMIREMSRQVIDMMENAVSGGPKYEVQGDDAWYDAGVDTDEWQHSF